MSWKLFGQIALLMVIAVTLIIMLKLVARCIYSTKHRMMKAETGQCAYKNMGNRGVMKAGYIK